MAGHFRRLEPTLPRRERSLEHQSLTPVFGTAAPRGASVDCAGTRTELSEARAARWLPLLAADRVDAVGSAVQSFATPRPGNPAAETGVLSELSHHGSPSGWAASGRI